MTQLPKAKGPDLQELRMEHGPFFQAQLIIVLSESPPIEPS